MPEMNSYHPTRKGKRDIARKGSRRHENLERALLWNELSSMTLMDKGFELDPRACGERADGKTTRDWKECHVR